MLERIRANRPLQLALGLLLGIVFGFLLQRGNVTYYHVIINQLLLKDFTVLKVMLAATLVGMVGVYAMRALGWVQLHLKAGSLGTTVPGGLIFGLGFGILGYCPGTAVGAVGHGAVDALVGGVVGMVLGAGVYAAVYPRLRDTVLGKGDFGKSTLPQLLNANPWFVILPACAIILAVFWALESAGL